MSEVRGFLCQGTIRVHEEDGLELFWATKIGGPSHGFDVEGQCFLDGNYFRYSSSNFLQKTKDTGREIPRSLSKIEQGYTSLYTALRAFTDSDCRFCLKSAMSIPVFEFAQAIATLIVLA